jgi:hypothetical protein
LTSCKTINYEKLTTQAQRDFMQVSAINYVPSLSDLGDLNMGLDLQFAACPHVSAGTTVHEYTAGFSWPMIM